MMCYPGTLEGKMACAEHNIDLWESRKVSGFLRWFCLRWNAYCEERARIARRYKYRLLSIKEAA